MTTHASRNDKPAYAPPPVNGDFYRMLSLLSEEERAIVRRVRDFMESEVAPIIEDYWAKDKFPFEIVPKLRALDIAGIGYRGYGTAGGSWLLNAVLCMEIARVDASIATFWGVHTGLSAGSIYLCGDEEQKQRWLPAMMRWEKIGSFGLTEPDHGSDATHMETQAVRATRDGVSGWVINGEKMWTTGMHVATHCATFARTSGNDGDARGITCFLVPANTAGVKVEEYLWTFNMPTDHPRVSFTDVFVPDDALFGEVGRGLSLAQCFVHENRIRQAASSLGAAVYCINESVRYARERKPFGHALSENQAIQFPLVELATQAEMLRLLIRKTAWEMDRMTQAEVEHRLSDKVSMCNFWANRLCCEAADRAMQVHGGMGYSRHKPFEHIYRHHRRYRITEGSEEIQKRKVAGFLFGYMGAGKFETTEKTR